MGPVSWNIVNTCIYGTEGHSVQILPPNWLKITNSGLLQYENRAKATNIHGICYFSTFNGNPLFCMLDVTFKYNLSQSLLYCTCIL